MSVLDKVRTTARLAQLDLEDSELTKTASQFQQILSFFAQLEELPTEGVPPTFSPLPEDSQELLRDDSVRNSLPTETVLESAPSRSRSYFKVPRVIE